MLAPASAVPELMIPPQARQLLPSQSRHLPGACPLGGQRAPSILACCSYHGGAGAQSLGWGRGWALATGPVEPNPPSALPAPEETRPAIPPHTTKAALRDLAVIEARVWERQPPPLSASQGARPHWRSWRWECGMPHPHSQAPHVHSTRLPWMGLPRAPSMHLGGRDQQAAAGLPHPGAGCFESGHLRPCSCLGPLHPDLLSSLSAPWVVY